VSELVLTRLIAASPETVYSFFTDLDRWIAWQGVNGELDPTPGGALRIEMPAGQRASGSFVELIPNRRVVFTWGWEGDAPPIAPGTTTVVIELEPAQRGTLLRLTHTGLDDQQALELHRAGWQRYLERLRTRAEGGDPGPDSPTKMPTP
jgi:uncharacterized protein YndB with AHSA1/START domain